MTEGVLKNETVSSEEGVWVRTLTNPSGIVRQTTRCL